MNPKQIRELRQKVGVYLDTQKNILERALSEGRALTAAEQKDHDGLTEKVNPLLETIRRAEGTHELDSDLSGQRSSKPERPGGSAARSVRPGEVRMLTREERVVDVINAPLPDNARPQDFSIGRAIRGKVTGEWGGAELEKRSMSEGSDTLGGFLLPEMVSGFYIDMARNRSALIEAGARTIPFETNALAVPTVDSDPTATWRAENSLIDETDVTIGRRNVTARSLAAIVRVSNELLADSADLAGQIIQSGLSKALGLEMDRAGLRGDGGALTPLGILNWPGVTVTNVAGNCTYDVLSKAATRIFVANEDPNAYIVSAALAGYFDLQKDGDGKWVGPSPDVAKLNRVKSNQAADTEAYVGAFSQCAIMPRQGIQIELSNVAGDSFQRNQTLIRAVLRCDFVVFRAGAFEVLTGITIPA